MTPWTHAPTGSHHRADVQGLRGIAVLLVIGYHVGAAVPGGFVGVDVFFVISGFVICSSLLRELDRTGSINLSAFYRRRVRRLLPALTLVLLVTVALAPTTLDVGGGRQAAAETARAASLFVANIQLEGATGYFTPVAEGNPLLHTWSLSIEEQFYLAFPAVLLLAAKPGEWIRRRRRIGVALVLIVVASFVVSAAAVSGGGTREAFFFAHLRAWEFGIGAVLAVIPGRWRRPTRPRWGSAAALAVLAVVAAGFSDDTLFPGPTAAVPVLAAAALIWFGSAGHPLGVLDNRALVWVGDRSYGLYLWHWPAIVFVTSRWPAVGWAPAAAAAASFVPTAATFVLVESPIRRTRWLRGLPVLTLAAVLITAPVAASFLLEREAEESLEQARPGFAELTAAWRTDCSPVPWPEERCTFGPTDARRVVALVGDSHANALGDVVTHLATTSKRRTAVLVKSGCPASLQPTTYEEGCPEWQEALVRELDALEPEVVIVVNRSPLYVRGETPGVDKPPNPAFPITPDADVALELWADGLDRFLATIDAPVLLVRTVPEHPIARADVTSGRLVDRYDGIPAGAHHERSGEIWRTETAVADDYDHVVTYDPTEALCTPRCRIGDRERIWYLDGDHISPRGSFELEGELRRAMRAARSRG